MKVMRQMAVFFRRDLAIAKTYRVAFVFEAVETLFGAALFYYAGAFVDSPALRNTLEGSTYFAFSLVGFVYFDYLNAAMDAFDRSLEEARDSGTLEHILVSQTSLPVFLAGSALYPFLSTMLRIAVYLGWGALLFGFPLAGANWFSVIAVLIVSALPFAGLGILSASYLLLFKRGNPGKWLLLGISSVAGGMLFPVGVLPLWLRRIAMLNPVTYALEAMRSALIGGTKLVQMVQPLLVLLLFAAVLLPVSALTFGWALRRTQANGTLTHN
jgi:ABC-2 type transport system permease protein